MLGAVGGRCSCGTACRSAIVAIGVALALWATGVLELEQALAGFGDPTVIFIASLFVVSEGLEAAGVTAWVGQQLVARVGESRTRLIVLHDAAGRAADRADQRQRRGRRARAGRRACWRCGTGRPPSQLLLPLAFGAHAGSLLALTGTPVNVIVSDAAADAGVGRFGFFEFALVGVPLRGRDDRDRRCCSASGCCPQRDRAVDRARLQRPRAHARRAVRARARADALLTRRAGRRRGRDPAALGARRRHRVPGHGHADSGDLVILAVQRQGEDVGPGETVLAEGDTLLLQGTWAALDEQPRATRTCSSSTRRSSSAGRPSRSARAPSARIAVLGGDGRAARHRRRARRRSPGCSRRAAMIAAAAC